MNKLEQQIYDAINRWGTALFKGVGTITIPNNLDAKGFVLYVLQRFYSKRPTAKSLVLTDTFEQRGQLIEYLLNQEDEDNNKEFKRLISNKTLMLASSNVYERSMVFPRNELIIIYCPSTFNRVHIGLCNVARFKFCILNKSIKVEEQRELYKCLPSITTIDTNVINEMRTTSPVEEMYVPVLIPDNSPDAIKLEEYNTFIRNSLSIFGSFETIAKAQKGDNNTNRSPLAVCTDLARENGWHEHLDMSSPIDAEIDKHFNPITIKEKADVTYNVIRERGVFLSDYVGKLYTILDVINNHTDDKILIISKRGEFAARITDYININKDEDVCGNYHLNVEPIPAVDEYGNPVFVKTGGRKGERKMLAGQAQCTLNEKRFNNNSIHILSTSNAPNKDLSVHVDVVIITSPLCEDIHAFMYRLANVDFNRKKLKLYTLYVKNTMEEQKLMNKPILENHIVINREEITNGSANNSDFIVVD